MDRTDPALVVWRQTAVVCGAILGATLLYAVVVEVLRARALAGLAAPEALPLLRWVFFGLAAGHTVGVHLARRWARGMPRALDEEAALDRLRTAAIVAAALAETVAIYGLVLFLLGGYERDFYALFVWSLVLGVTAFPRRGEWRDWLAARGRIGPRR